MRQPSRHLSPSAQPFAAWNPKQGIWETFQPDLSGHLEPFSETWPTSGMTCDGLAYPLPPSAHPISGTESSSSPVIGLRTPVASDAERGHETVAQVKARRGTILLTHQLAELADNLSSPERTIPEDPEELVLIAGLFDAGDATPPRSHDGND